VVLEYTSLGSSIPGYKGTGRDSSAGMAAGRTTLSGGKPILEGLRAVHALCCRVAVLRSRKVLRQVGVYALGETFPLLVLAKDRTRLKGPGMPWHDRKIGQPRREASL